MSRHPSRTSEFVNLDDLRIRGERLRCWLLGATVLLGVAGSRLIAQTPTEASAPALEAPVRSSPRQWNLRQTPVVEVVRRVKDSVVNIHSERTVRAGNSVEEMFSRGGSRNRVNGMGTGILIDPRGYIITNQHVVEDVAVLRIRLADGTTADGRVLARDKEDDLALLKIEVDHPLATVPLGSTRDLMVGETVIAIGNAYGYAHTVTVGVVSAKSRDVNLNKEVSYKSLIQTDASINPGNSGGPLLNLHGELIGINVAIRAGAQGIGFAIPVDTMIRAAGRMIAACAPGGGSRSRLGLRVKDEVHAAPPGSAPGETARLRTVVIEALEQGSPAARAGLRRGDILLAAGAKPIVNSLDLERVLLDRPSGEHLALRYRHGEAEKTIEVALESGRGNGVEQAVNHSEDLIWRKLGLHLRSVGGEVVRRSSTRFRGGLSVTEIRPGSPADHAGVHTGDILVGLHTFEMLNPDHIRFVLNHPDAASFRPLKFYVLRGGQLQSGSFQLDE